MSASAEMVRIGLLALLTGIALPLLVQLFVVLRNLQRVTNALDRRLDRALLAVEEVAGDVKRGASAPPSWAAVVAALLPAIVAAGRAFRAGVAAEPTSSPDNHVQEKRS